MLIVVSTKLLWLVAKYEGIFIVITLAICAQSECI